MYSDVAVSYNGPRVVWGSARPFSIDSSCLGFSVPCDGVGLLMIDMCSDKEDHVDVPVNASK